MLIFFVLLVLQSYNIRQETWLIPVDMQPGWVSIEYDNPKCQILNGTALSQEFVVPKTGYLCTSSPLQKGPFQRKYFLMGADGQLTPLSVGKDIWREGVLSKDEPSLDKGLPRCNVSLDQFFYGSKDDLKEESSIFQNEIFLRDYHPECRNTGTLRLKNPQRSMR